MCNDDLIKDHTLIKAVMSSYRLYDHMKNAYDNTGLQRLTFRNKRFICGRRHAMVVLKEVEKMFWGILFNDSL